MGIRRSFQDESYRQHAKHYREYAAGGAKESLAKTWLQQDTVDIWLHRRMYRLLDPFLETDSGASWLTVGDGRYGRDARYILDRGSSALATDISDTLLREAKDRGYIPSYRIENAEALSFHDAEFDYAFCKEAYHHFPRPMVALYEMLRVARKGVLLVEPNDAYIHKGVGDFLFRHGKDRVKRLLGREVSRGSFEVSGNYVFSISRREIEKVALGLNCRGVAFRGLNNAYYEGVEYEKVAAKGPLHRKVRLRIAYADLLCWIGLMDYGLLGAAILKDEPSEVLLDRLGTEEWEIVQLPHNPYISG
jgi:ubiquinone/menaquinone biosynthesis C-methylase UbiE